ncbi:MAG: TerB family tellurite resistance protein [Pseudomonadota bacterium]
MPVLLTVLGLLAAVGYWYFRIRDAGDTVRDLADAANDVRLAARRFGFKRRANVHPIDCIEDARMAAAGITLSVAEMDGALTQSEIQTATIQFQSVFDISKDEAEELVTFGRWIASQSGTRAEGVRRMTKRLLGIAGAEAGPDLIKLVTAVGTADGGTLHVDAEDALQTIRRYFPDA